MGRILVKNKKRHRPSTGGVPDSSIRKRPLEQSNSALSESSAATEPSSPQLGEALARPLTPGLTRTSPLAEPNPLWGPSVRSQHNLPCHQAAGHLLAECGTSDL